jgi:hypothetical protein
MISGGISSGGDFDWKWQRYTNNLGKRQVFKIEKRFYGFDAPITFSDADFRTIYFLHDDTLVLSLKMKPAIDGWVEGSKGCCVDTKSLADILYKSTFD